MIHKGIPFGPWKILSPLLAVKAGSTQGSTAQAHLRVPLFFCLMGGSRPVSRPAMPVSPGDNALDPRGSSVRCFVINAEHFLWQPAREFSEKHLSFLVFGVGAEGDELKMMLMGLKRFTKTEPFNTTAARQEVAVKLIEEGKYCW